MAIAPTPLLLSTPLAALPSGLPGGLRPATVDTGFAAAMARVVQGRQSTDTGQPNAAWPITPPQPMAQDKAATGPGASLGHTAHAVAPPTAVVPAPPTEAVVDPALPAGSGTHTSPHASQAARTGPSQRSGKAAATPVQDSAAATEAAADAARPDSASAGPGTAAPLRSGGRHPGSKPASGAGRGQAGPSPSAKGRPDTAPLEGSNPVKPGLRARGTAEAAEAPAADPGALAWATGNPPADAALLAALNQPARADASAGLTGAAAPDTAAPGALALAAPSSTGGIATATQTATSTSNATASTTVGSNTPAIDPEAAGLQAPGPGLAGPADAPAKRSGWDARASAPSVAPSSDRAADTGVPDAVAMQATTTPDTAMGPAPARTALRAASSADLANASPTTATPADAPEGRPAPPTGPGIDRPARGTGPTAEHAGSAGAAGSPAATARSEASTGRRASPAADAPAETPEETLGEPRAGTAAATSDPALAAAFAAPGGPAAQAAASATAAAPPPLSGATPPEAARGAAADVSTHRRDDSRGAVTGPAGNAPPATPDAPPAGRTPPQAAEAAAEGRVAKRDPGPSRGEARQSGAAESFTQPTAATALADSGSANPAAQVQAQPLASPTSATPAGSRPPPAQASIDIPIDQPGFAPALGAQISVLARDGVQEARLQLNPAEMGPITVQITVDGTAARVDFQAEVASTRGAIEASLPALAGALKDAGLTLAGGGVFQQSPQHGQQQQDSSGRQPQASGTRRGPRDDAAGLDAPPVRLASGRRGLVDLVA